MSDAISIYTDFKVYEPEFNAGFHEQIYLNSNIFNGASRGAIQLITQVHPGHYYTEAYFKQVSSLVTRQDITSTSAVDSKKLEQVEEIGVKVHRKIGPVQSTLKAWSMAGLETPEGSMMLGRQVGDAVSKQMASDAIISVVAAVGGQTALIKDVTGESVKTATIGYLNATRLKWGDQLTKLAVWLMHSKVFGDLVDDGLTIELESVAGALVARGGVAALMGGGMVISDNTNLINSGTPDTYNVIGMASGAALVKQSELQNIVIEMLTGYEQLIVEIQGEYANTISVEGFAWDTTSGGVNPNDTALGTTTNWDKVRSDTTGLPLVKLLSQ